jgi:hypothetical protein
MKKLIEELKNLTNPNTVFYDIQRITKQMEIELKQLEEEYAVIMELHHE